MATTIPPFGHPDHPRGCPHPATEAELEYERQSAVDWLHPGELARAGVKTALAGTFGAYADRREMQAALSPLGKPEDEYHEHELDGDALWFDYVADVGDGFDATYAMARLLAMDLTVDGTQTKRGTFVLLGGDQVYPTAARDEYRNRFLGPYRAALPYVDESGVPRMYAIPGNHDWYDGLTSFLHIFCQRTPPKDNGRWVGAWHTRQRRSYFAIKLPDNWWIWAIDGQLESDFDQPQLRYFAALAAEMKQPEEQKIILVTAAPSWTQCPAPGSDRTSRNAPDDFRTLAHFEKQIRAKGFQLKLVLAGDLHHYVRYASEAAPASHTMRITSGGGGAYLFGTGQMPERLAVREGSRETVEAQEPLHPYRRMGSFPDRSESRKVARAVWGLPWRNWPFGGLLGVVYLLLAWLLQSGSRGTGGVIEGSLLEAVQKGGPIAKTFAQAFLFNPLATALGLLLFFGFFAYTSSSATGHPKLARFLGLVHGLGHVVLCCALMAVIALVLQRERFGLHPGEEWFNVVLIGLLLVLGWFFGSLLYATFLWLTSRTTGVHANEVFSSIASEDWKNFLRFRLGADGVLTVFAIGLRKVPHDWKFVAPGPDDHGKPWFHSEKFGKGDYAPHLIERFEVR